jgi:phage gp46-like protein
MDHFDGDPLIYDSGDGGDLLIVGGQPMMSSGLENAVYLSLLVDANWWGNDVDPATPGATGSKFFLPLIGRAKLTPSLLIDAEKAADADLAWMVSDGVAKSVDVDCTMVDVGLMGVVVTVTEPDGDVTTVKWKLNWSYLETLAS